MSLTRAALQRAALVVSEFVSRAAAQAPVCRHTGEAVGRTGLAAFPHRVEESFRTGVPTLTLEQVSGHLKFIWGWEMKDRTRCTNQTYYYNPEQGNVILAVWCMQGHASNPTLLQLCVALASSASFTLSYLWLSLNLVPRSQWNYGERSAGRNGPLRTHQHWESECVHN